MSYDALTYVAEPEQAPATEKAVSVGSAELWCWDTSGDGEAIVFCHPASQSCRVWGFQQPVFAAAGYRVIGYSRRGYYKSTRGAEGDPGTSVGDLVALLDQLGIARAHLIGAAAGGIVALATAVAHPDRVASVVLAGTIFSIDEDAWREMFGRLGLAALRGILKTEFLELGPSYRARNPAGVARFKDLETIAKPSGRFDQPSGVRVTWAKLAGLQVPVLLLTGEADLYAPPPLQNLIAEHLPDCETATLREVGHAAYWEAPTAFNRMVLDFLGHRSSGHA
jgi:pimeloyl-ACP methyl ester carboxylesterase